MKKKIILNTLFQAKSSRLFALINVPGPIVHTIQKGENVQLEYCHTAFYDERTSWM